MKVDLHAHSNRSDGVLQPKVLIEAAARAGVDVLALTDHDTSSGVPEALEVGERLGVRVLPGMEVSAHHEGLPLHILAFFAPEALERLAPWQAMRQRSRQARLEAMLDRLDELGYPVDRAAVAAELAEGGPARSAGRPHVARALIRAGHVQDFNEAFERFLKNEGPAYVADQGPSAAEAIELIHALPGVAVVAHCGIGDVHLHLEELAQLGLDGVEVNHPAHDEETRAALLAKARELGLLVSGGSDFHGTRDDLEGKEAHEWIGRHLTPPAEWERIETALGTG